MSDTVVVKCFTDQGTIDGVQYVDVILTSDDPYEFLIPLAQAVTTYGSQPVLTMAEWEQS